jgi:sterol desaturase/sphingolipid hydroxylase (fatty acid hydroxylase superfamily)
MREDGASRTRRWPVNFGLTALNIVVMGALPLTALAAADIARDAGWGLFNLIEAPFVVALGVGFLVRSLVSWFIHYAMHNVPVLWRVHRVHHTDTHLDVSTTVRFHPLEFLVSAPFVIATVMAFGLPPIVVMLFELFDAAIAVFSHANTRMPVWLDRALGVLVITPNMHRIHHSTVEPETNSNYGATLVIWDRLFGTFRRKSLEDLAAQPLGLAETQDRRASSFWYLLTLPFRPVRIEPKSEERAIAEPAE